MSACNPQTPPNRQSREQLEEQLLAEVRQAESEFRNASPDQKEAVAERYRQALQRFNDLILGRKPPGTSREP